jgi:hypothetical protein
MGSPRLSSPPFLLQAVANRKWCKHGSPSCSSKQEKGTGIEELFPATLTHRADNAGPALSITNKALNAAVHTFRNRAWLRQKAGQAAAIPVVTAAANTTLHAVVASKRRLSGPGRAWALRP